MNTAEFVILGSALLVLVLAVMNEKAHKKREAEAYQEGYRNAKKEDELLLAWYSDEITEGEKSNGH